MNRQFCAPEQIRKLVAGLGMGAVMGPAGNNFTASFIVDGLGFVRVIADGHGIALVNSDKGQVITQAEWIAGEAQPEEVQLDGAEPTSISRRQRRSRAKAAEPEVEAKDEELEAGEAPEEPEGETVTE